MKKRFSYSIIIPLTKRKKERKKERKEKNFFYVLPPFSFFSRQNCFFSQCKLFSLFFFTQQLDRQTEAF